MARTTAPRHGRQSWRRRLLRVWLICALPWLFLVAALSIYDHHRAITRAALSQRGPSALAETIGLGGQEPAILALRWLEAAVAYSGEAVAFYGVLPAGLTFALYVLFLPWADGWARQGTIQD